jgi:hypothetical protein
MIAASPLLHNPLGSRADLTASRKVRSISISSSSALGGIGG